MPQGNAWLWLSLIFWRLKNLDFLYFAVSVPCFVQLRLWWNCASWIDHNMHWALIDLFCDNLFVYNTIEFSSVALNWLATSAFKNWYAILCLRKRLALTESLFFWRPKSLDFLYFAVSVPCFNRLRLWWNCAFELIIKTIGLWLTCFLTKFVCITWVFSCCFRVAGFDCFQKELCAILCLKEDESWPLTESVFFVELNSEIFLLRFLLF